MNDQLQMIDRVLGELQNNVARRAVNFFRGGWVIFGGCMAHYLLAYLGREELVKVVWITVPVLCILIGVFFGSRASNHSNISNSEKLLGSVWGIVGLVMIYLSLIAPRLGFISRDMGLPLVLLMLFITVSITGITIKHTPTIALSSMLLIGSVAGSILGGQFHLDILTIVILTGFILPSYLIKAKYL